MQPTRKEMIDYIIEESRKNAKSKKPKTVERQLAQARLHLMKSTDLQIERLYAAIVENGIENTLKGNLKEKEEENDNDTNEN